VRIEQFGPDKTGQLIPISVAAPGVTHAFIPDPLPPKWEWPVRLWPLLLEARTALATLDGTGRHLPTPDLVLRPLQNREAQRSSSLEGTYTDPAQQVLFQIEPRLPESSDDPANAYREVFNYGTALRLRLESKESIPVSLRLIRELHRVLMDGVRGADRNPGEFRRMQNQIGRPARFVPPPLNHLPRALDAFEKYLHGSKKYDPLVEAFLVHYQFEAIHPFIDGNGRVGRLLLAILIAEWCKLSNQWLYMSDFFDSHKDEYIDRLFRISTEGQWEQWIEFCLKGVRVQATDTLRRCEKLVELRSDYHERLRQISAGSVRLAAIVDDLFRTPVALPARVAKKHNVTYPTARADLAKLAGVGILEELNVRTRVSYYSKAIFDITYAD
jgi:cell filamentation protein, protein adenylyltransferase